MLDTIVPHRRLLQELTVELNETGVDPFEGYELLCRRLGEKSLQFDTYCSSSITSGGHARNDSFNIMQIIQKNTDSAHDLCDELFRVGQLDPQTSIEAVAVGKVKHWSQSDYMEFWLSAMSRLPFTGAHLAKKVDTFRERFMIQRDRVNVEMDLYNNGTLGAEQRVIEYMKHADAFATIAQENEADPINRLVRLIDTDQSLGAQTENYFARVMGTNVMRVAVAHVGGETLPATYPAKRLVTDTQSIVNFGGHVFDPTRRTQLVLVPDDLANN